MHAPTTPHEPLRLKASPLSRLGLALLCCTLITLAAPSVYAESHTSGIAVKPAVTSSSSDISVASADSSATPSSEASEAIESTASAPASEPAAAEDSAQSLLPSAETKGEGSAAVAASGSSGGSSYGTLTSGQKLGAGTPLGTQHKGELSGGGLSSPEGIIKWLLSTIAILGLIFACAYMLKRSRFVQRGAGPIVVESQIALGPKERVVQLKVGERHLLVGVTASSVNFLCDLTEKAPEPQAPAPQAPQAPQGYSAATPPVYPQSPAAGPLGADYAAYQERAFLQAMQQAEQERLHPSFGAAPQSGAMSPDYFVRPHYQGPAEPQGMRSVPPVPPQVYSSQGAVPAQSAGAYVPETPAAGVMQGLKAVEDEDLEPPFTREAIAPLYPEEEMGATAAQEAPASAVAKGSAYMDGAEERYAAAGSKERGAIGRRPRGRKTGRRSATAVDPSYMALPDDSVLKARAHRSKRERYLEEQSRQKDSFDAKVSSKAD